jgi:DNA polymerase I-like protein with 3'-5' exonuclease and polymerase domains
MESFPTIPDWVSLEHQVAQILTDQELYGWSFDERAAWELESTLRRELESLVAVLRDRHPNVAGSIFNPKRSNKIQGYFVSTGITEKHEHCGALIDINDCSMSRLKELNASSRDHIAWIFQTFYDWTPTEFTDKGKASIDETVLKEIGTPIALQFFRVLELTKQLGLLSEGVNGWLKLVRNGRIHHNCSVATATHRCAHRKPNLAQVPAEQEFRKLFTATPGLQMVGADLAGIELRMLAHYLARFDNGQYADILLNDDIHQVNADKIGISRRAVKTVTYAFLYGAGDEKIGLSFDPLLPKNKARKRGKEIRQAFMDAIDGLETLVTKVKEKAAGGYINSIDGRKISVDGTHKALNYLLQSSAGVIAKRWMVTAHDTIQSANIKARQLGFVHDELAFECADSYVTDLSFTLEHSAVTAGEYYNMRIPIAADAKSGSTWAEVH